MNKLKRNLNDLRKVERDSRMHDLRANGRKVQGRKPSPLHAFILQKRPEFFVGLGTGDEVPVCMQVRAGKGSAREGGSGGSMAVGSVR